MVELAYVWVGLVGGGEVGRGWASGARGPGRALVGLDGPGWAWVGCSDVGGLCACRRGPARVGPVFTLVGGSAWGPAMRSSRLRRALHATCPAPHRAAPHPGRGAREQHGQLRGVRPTPGAGRAGGAAWSTCLDHMTGHHRCGRRSGRAPPEGTGIYRGQRLGRGLPFARGPCAGGRSGVWAGLGPRGGAGADSDGGGDRDTGPDPDARAGTATGSAPGTECGPSVPWTRPPAPAGRCGNDEGDPAHVVRGTGSPVVLVGDTGIEPVTSSV